mmetsp:Transcript_15296/g.35212  ORF Transcript_15296/g.35212 Transcript_15296/m.35212 type:complete len:202 (-) Transcript_15296:1017-1622(-)
MHTCQRQHVPRACTRRMEARVLELRGKGIARVHLILFGHAFDRALAHCLRHDDVCRVVVDGAVDRHVVTIKGLPEEAVWRHLEAGGALACFERDVQPLLVLVEVCPAEEPRGRLDGKLVVGDGDARLALVLAPQLDSEFVDGARWRHVGVVLRDLNLGRNGLFDPFGGDRQLRERGRVGVVLNEQRQAARGARMHVERLDE